MIHGESWEWALRGSYFYATVVSAWAFRYPGDRCNPEILWSLTYVAMYDIDIVTHLDACHYRPPQ